MSLQFLIQFAASGAAITLLVALAAWARIARPCAPLDESRAGALLAQEFPGRRIDALWLAADGAGALARSGDRALVLSRLGDGYVARDTGWAQARAAQGSDGLLRLTFADPGAPVVRLALADWPARERAA